MYCVLRPCFHKSLRTLSAIKLKHVCICFGIIVILDFFGVFTHIFEVPFDDNFVYPYNGDIHEFIIALRHNQKPDVPPINVYNYSFVYDIRNKCLGSGFQTIRVVFLIKSAIENVARRMAIRNSWGFEKRFSDVPIKTIFLLGTHYDNDELRAKINLEAVKYQDIVQADFYDSYYNNTIKTMMGFKWAKTYCSNSKFYMFVDDDMYVSVKNVLRFLKNPTLYPDYLKDAVKLDKRDVQYTNKNLKRSIAEEEMPNNQYVHNKNNNSIKSMLSKLYSNKQNFELKQQKEEFVHNNVTSFMNESKVRLKRQVLDFELPDNVRLFSGFVFVSAPHRHKSSKWYVSLKDYPYDMWPPYVTAGAYILSKEALLDMFYASMYTKHFKFDDIFLGFVAKKADIEPFHCEEFHFYKKDYTKYNYKYVISSHGYGNPDELLTVWNEQKALGNA